MSDEDDLASRIAAFLADAPLAAPISELAKDRAGLGAARWHEMRAAFPEASDDELWRGTMIAVELMTSRAEEISAKAEALRKRMRE